MAGFSNPRGCKTADAGRLADPASDKPVQPVRSVDHPQELRTPQGNRGWRKVEAVGVLSKEGAMKFYCCPTHPVLSGEAINRIASCEELEQVIVTDTIPLREEAAKLSKIKVLSTADVFSKAILRTFNHDSVRSLFV